MTIAQWRHAAYAKARTRRAIIDRARAGESLESIAEDYDVPVEWVRAITAPGFDLSGTP